MIYTPLLLAENFSCTEEEFLLGLALFDAWQERFDDNFEAGNLEIRAAIRIVKYFWEKILLGVYNSEFLEYRLNCVINSRATYGESNERSRI